MAGAVMMLLACVLLFPPVAAAQTTVSREYPIKGAFLFNFAQFVEWPTNTNSNAPFVIGVLGADPFGETLDKIVKNESIGSRPIAVKRSRNINDLKQCQILFVSRSEADRMKEVLAAVESLPILTVSETDGFCRMGGMINFYKETSKVRFEINNRAAERHGLKISSELIRIGKMVEDDR